LEERVKLLERGTSIGKTAIDKGDLTIREGSLVVLDADGNPRIRIGLLDDGNYDLAAISVAGTTVNLAQLAFGAQASYDTTACTRNGTAFQDPDTGTAGPTLTNVLVGASRRLKVTISSVLDYGFSSPAINAGASISFSIAGATTVAADIEYSLGAFDEHQTAPVLKRGIHRASYVHYFGPDNTGSPQLNPGLHTITMKYRSVTNVGNFSDRLLMVEPW
jgi:hypothetical protein